jgi:phosphatidylethanolamine/phosphatidyl-N-methylethanolamine N-methyltransferase
MQVQPQNGHHWGNGRLAFFMGFLRNPTGIGSVIPSSRWLERRLVETAAIGSSRLVVELGPGTGGTTRAILKALPPESTLLAIEINPVFIGYLQACPDPRLSVYPGSAEHLPDALASVNHGRIPPGARADAVISGIPFSTMPPEVGRRIIRSIWDCMAPGGRFVAYQVMGRVAELAPPVLGNPDVKVEFLNIPPLRVFHWQKPA